MFFGVVIATYLSLHTYAHPISNTKEYATSANNSVTKRYFGDAERVYDTPKNVRGDERDFMTEVIDHALHHRKIKPDRWMDFYNNGAKWGHYVSPQIHHPSVTNIHDPHFDAHLTYTDAYDETNRNAENQENHVEAYPGELVSGENSLSKFIAPPVFDEPDAASRDTISSKNKQKEHNFLNTPEAAATENSNTRKLVDSLNSFMTPLKVPSEESNDENARTRENLDESKDLGTSDKQISKYIESESKLSQAEPGSPQYESSIQEIIRHETATSRDGLERAENNPAASSINSNNNNENQMRYEQENAERQRFEGPTDKNVDNYHDENREEPQNEFQSNIRDNEYSSHAQSDFRGRERTENEDRGNENAEMVSKNNENGEMMLSRANENREMMASSRTNENEYREHLRERSEHDIHNESPHMERFHEMGDERESEAHSRFLPLQTSEDSERHENIDNGDMNEESRYNNDFHSPDRSEIRTRTASRFMSPEKPGPIEIIQDTSGRMKPAQSSDEAAVAREFLPSHVRFAEDREEKMSLLHHQLRKLKKSTV